MGGPAVSFSKGDHAISLSVLAPVEDWSQRESGHQLEGSTIFASTDGSNDYYLGDLRYHTSANDKLSWFVGYKIGFNSWKDRITNDSNNLPVYEEEGATLSHGPILGSNISFPIETAGLPLAIWASVAYGPVMIDHDEIDIWRPDTADPDHLEESGTSFDTWYLNPEVGIRTNITRNSSFNLSYRSDIWGDYHQGAWVSVGGPSVSFSIKW